MNKKDNHPSKDTTYAIMEAYLALLKNKNIHRITVQNVCNLAQINRTTFYVRYADINELTQKKIEKELSEHSNDIFLKTDVPTFNSHECFLSCFIQVFEFFRENRDFYYPYISKNMNIISLELSDKKPFHSAFVGTGVYNNDEEYKYIQYRLAFFNAGVSSIIQLWLKNHCHESPSDMAHVIFSEYRIEV